MCFWYEIQIEQSDHKNLDMFIGHANRIYVYHVTKL